MPLRADVRARLSPWALLALLGLAWSAAFPYFEAVRNANERPRLVQAMALVDDASFALDGPARRGLELGPDIARSPVSDRLYPNKAPGASLLGAVGYVAAKATAGDEPPTLRILTWWCRLMTGLLPTLVIAAIAWRRYAHHFGPQLTFLALSTYAFATPAFSYMRLYYGHQLAACLVFAAITMFVDAHHFGRIRTAAVAGLLGGFAIAVEYGAAFAGIPVALFALSGMRTASGIRVTLAAAAGCALVLALLGIYHAVAFGSPWATGYHHVVNADFASKHAQGILGLSWPRWAHVHTHLFASGGGLLWWAPLFPIALYGLVQLASASATSSPRWQSEAKLQAAAFVVVMLASWCLSFDGGWRVGPRYLVAVYPCLVLGWIHVFGQLRSHPVAVVGVGSVLVFALAVNTMAATLWPHFDLTNVHSPVSEVLLPLIQGDYLPYNWGDWLGLPRPGWLVFGIPIAGGVLAFARNMFFGIRMLASLVVAALLGFLAVYAQPLIHAPHPRARDNLAYIERVYEPRPQSRKPAPSRTLEPLAAPSDSSPSSRRAADE